MWTLDLRLPTGDDVPWLCLISDPVTLLHIARGQWGQSKHDVATGLVRRGLPFRTLTIAAANPPPPSHPKVDFVVSMPAFKPRLDDFYVWEGRVRSLLRGSRGRAALMKGGIIWRIAMEVLSEEAVLLGPSDDINVTYTLCIADINYADDDLTSDELELICGVYKVLNSKFLSSSMFYCFRLASSVTIFDTVSFRLRAGQSGLR